MAPSVKTDQNDTPLVHNLRTKNQVKVVPVVDYKEADFTEEEHRLAQTVLQNGKWAKNTLRIYAEHNDAEKDALPDKTGLSDEMIPIELLDVLRRGFQRLL